MPCGPVSRKSPTVAASSSRRRERPRTFSKRIFDIAETEPSWRRVGHPWPAPWSDPDEIAAEQRRMFPSTFARLWLNEWVAPDDSIADPDDVDAACVLGRTASHPTRPVLMCAVWTSEPGTTGRSPSLLTANAVKKLLRDCGPHGSVDA